VVKSSLKTCVRGFLSSKIVTDILNSASPVSIALAMQACATTHRSTSARTLLPLISEIRID
jgi:hypothetical protein